MQESWGTRWLAIPADRDQLASDYDGVLTALARLRTRKLAVFGPEPPSVKGLTYNSRHLDRRSSPVSTGRPGIRPRRSLPDADRFGHRRRREGAAGTLYRLEGARLAETPKQRRNRLAAFATSFYLYLATHSEVFATMEETAHLDYQPDGGVEAAGAERGRGRESEPWFVRSVPRRQRPDASTSISEAGRTALSGPALRREPSWCLCSTKRDGRLG